MSEYQNIYQDLPGRVHRIWNSRESNSPPESGEDLSVTAMLMAAAAGFAMPFENLKDLGAGNKRGWDDHPAFLGKDQAQYKKSLAACNEFLSQPIDDCIGLKDCFLMQCQKLRDIKNAAMAGNGHATLNTRMHNTRFALKILRNALAHNNILDVPDHVGQIEKLAFFSMANSCSSCGRMDGWHVLVISVEAFKQFLSAWFDLLKEPGSFAGAAEAVASS